MWPYKSLEMMIDYCNYAFLQWYYMIPNMMSRGTDVDRWISTICLNGAKQHQPGKGT